MVFSDRISGVQPSAIREIFKVLGDPSIISFAGGNPDPSTFPADKMAVIAAELFEKQPSAALQYSVTEGYPALREKIANRLKTKFNIGTDNDSLLVLTGGQQGIDLTCKVLCNEDDVVICEEPSFIGALNAFRTYKTRLRGVPMDDDGMNTDALEEVLKSEPRAKLIYTIPTFQNPMGVTMSLEKRKKVYELAKKYGVVILEDNPYGELRFAGEDLPSIKSFDTDGIVVYCGSFSKILSPGMRMGFVSAPAEIAAKMTVGKQVTDVHSNIFFQMLVNRFLEEYDIDEHIAKIRVLYKEKCEKMISCLEKNLPEGCSITHPQGGLFIWCKLPESIDANVFSKELVKEKLAVVPGSAFLTDESAKTSCIRLNYSMPTLEQIEKGTEILGRCIREKM
ncbi:MAG: PLP-dependent aminotransferase family protein [Ruminococcaceae bacterium]|nr:PLP-dependent aminotransferase family protein [Oscillospiraceae bacterium]